jgi:DNA polymerase elongation subunit (family B)
MTLPLDYDKKYGFCSRAITDPEIFIQTLEDRVRAKKAGDKATNLALKLVLNTTYGCMGNGQYKDGKYIAYNDLYDPLMCRSVCITGQLFLLELAFHLLKDVPTITIIQCNTDGIMISFDEDYYQIVTDIVNEWQERTGFELEEDKIKKIVQANVNNYVEVAEDGKAKLKGGMLVRGISEAGAFKINNNANVVARAVAEYFVNDTPPEETIFGCDEIFDFQVISKASSKYKAAYQEMFEVETVNEELGLHKVVSTTKVKTQKVNRVYATKDPRYGTLYKVHGETGRVAKVGGLPEHCIIDNSNELTIDVVDKDWYVALAKEQINAFLGVEPPRVNKRKLNSYKKTILKILEE